MKAIRISRTGTPDVLEYVDAPTPVPGPGEVLVRAHSIGVNFFDVLIRTGRYPWMPQLPFTPGNDMTGHVEATGPGVTKFKKGQPAFVAGYEIEHGGGLYAEYAAVPEDAVWALPDGVDLEQAIALPSYQLAWLLLNVGARGVEPKTVLVHGAAGSTGTALMDVAKVAGASVIGVVSSAARCDFVRSRGAAHAIDSSEGSLVEKVMAATSGRGADVIFDHVAGKNFTDGIKMLAPFGMLVSYGMLGGMPPPEANLFKEMRLNVERSPAVRSFSIHSYDHNPGPRRNALDRALELLASKKVSPAIGERFPLKDASRAHQLMEGRLSLGKLVLQP